LRARVQAGQSRHVLLVSGGAGGVELLLAVAHRLRRQANALTIFSTGARHAILTRNGLTLDGYWAWRLKNWIDRRFIARFDDLPQPASTRSKAARPI
jgi:NADH dehydrogenase FAD-containing subunit